MKPHNLLIICLLLFYCAVTIHACGLKNQSDEVTFEANVRSVENKLNKEIEIIGLLYHRFGEDQYPSTNISIQVFKQQLAYLKQNNIPVISLTNAIEKLKSNEGKGRYVVITIDDAFDSFLENGFPIIREFGYTATLFINTETVGSGDYIGWEDLNYLKDNGIEIGNHTHSHDYFLDMDATSRHQAFIEDVLIAKKIIKEKLKIDPKIFAFPFGEYDNNMKEELKELGFICAAAQNSGVISSYSDLFALPRFPMTDLYGKMDVFKEKIKMKALPVIKTTPVSNMATKNPPVLEFLLDTNEFQFEQMQCFIQGGKCEIVKIDSLGLAYRVKTDKVLTSRRVLYTITVPDNNNKNWYWYSFQWVFPNSK